MSRLTSLIHETYDDEYFIVRTDAEDLELFPKHVNKGQAMRYLAKHLKIDLSEIMAIGDMDNDLPILSIVGKSVAVKNATDQVKFVCDSVTDDNEHSGVAMAIEKYALGRVRS